MKQSSREQGDRYVVFSKNSSRWHFDTASRSGIHFPFAPKDLIRLRISFARMTFTVCVILEGVQSGERLKDLCLWQGWDSSFDSEWHLVISMLLLLIRRWLNDKKTIVCDKYHISAGTKDIFLMYIFSSFYACSWSLLTERKAGANCMYETRIGVYQNGILVLEFAQETYGSDTNRDLFMDRRNARKRR